MKDIRARTVLLLGGPLLLAVLLGSALLVRKEQPTMLRNERHSESRSADEIKIEPVGHPSAPKQVAPNEKAALARLVSELDSQPTSQSPSESLTENLVRALYSVLSKHGRIESSTLDDLLSRSTKFPPEWMCDLVRRMQVLRHVDVAERLALFAAKNAPRELALEAINSCNAILSAVNLTDGDHSVMDTIRAHHTSLLATTDLQVRLAAVRAAPQFYRDSTSDRLAVLLFSVMTQDFNDEVRMAAANLARPDVFRGNESIADQIARMYSTTNDPEGRRRILYVLGQTGSELASALAETALSDKDPTVVRVAIQICGNAGIVKSIPYLSRMLFDDKGVDSTTRVYVLNALSKIPDEGAALAITARLVHETDESLRGEIYEALRRSPSLVSSDKVITELIGIASRMEKDDDWRSLVEVLSRSEGDRTYNWLISQYTSAGTGERRDAAASAVLASKRGLPFALQEFDRLACTGLGGEAVGVISKGDRSEALKSFAKAYTPSTTKDLPKATKTAIVTYLQDDDDRVSLDMLRRLEPAEPDPQVKRMIQEAISKRKNTSGSEQ